MNRKRKILLVVAICWAVILAAFVVTGGVILSHANGDAGAFSYLLVLGTAVEGTEPSSMLQTLR